MRRLVLVFGVAVLALWGQKIETRQAGDNQVFRLGTALDHLSVIELGEPVLEVAAGSPAFKIEWRENKVFVLPLEPEASTNLFIWTQSGRLNYELMPAGTIERMHFAIDEKPAVEAAPPASQPTPAASVQQPKFPPEMLLSSTAVRMAGNGRRRASVEVLLRDVYRRDGKLYLRYTIRNHGRAVYRLSAPAMFLLRSPRTRQSLLTLSNTQLVGKLAHINHEGESAVRMLHDEIEVKAVAPGETTYGVVAFEMPARAMAGEPLVVRLAFPRDASGEVDAILVL